MEPQYHCTQKCLKHVAAIRASERGDRNGAQVFDVPDKEGTTPVQGEAASVMLERADTDIP